MQINLFSPLIKEFLKYLGWVLLFFVLWFHGCSRTAPTVQTAKVTIPEVKGSFEPKKPSHDKLEKPFSRRQEKGSKVNKEKPIDSKLIQENEKLKQDFVLANDTIKNFSFQKAIQLNRFSTNFEDENLILNFEGIVQGEVKEITPSYTIKAKKTEVAVKVKETVFRVLVGGGIGLNKELNQAAYQLDLNFQNRKGNIISAEYLSVGGQEFGMVGYKWSIINIKR